MMTKKKSTPRRNPFTVPKQREDSEDVIFMFLNCDGVRGGLDGMPYYENKFLARAAWKSYRAQTWEAWELRGQCWPPTAATVYDSLSEKLWFNPHGTGSSRTDLDRTALQLHQDAETDLAALAAFRDTPAAQECEPHLGTFEGILLTAIDELRRLDPRSVPHPSDLGWWVWRHFDRDGLPAGVAAVDADG